MSTLQAERINLGDFKALQGWLKDRSAIVLEDSRRSIAEKRLTPLLWRHRLGGFNDLLRALEQEPEGSLAAEVLDQLTNTETWFFRDAHPFDALRQTVLPTLIEQRQAAKSLRIWSAGCSSGQELYSLAMLLDHHFPHLGDWELDLVGTDLSEAALQKAHDGLFSTEEINRGLPVALLVKYFQQEGAQWRLDPRICAMTHFFPGRVDEGDRRPDECDLILMRNVLYHFDQAHRQAVVQDLWDRLRPKGCLFLGSGERLEQMDGWEQVVSGRGIHYRKIWGDVQ